MAFVSDLEKTLRDIGTLRQADEAELEAALEPVLKEILSQETSVKLSPSMCPPSPHECQDKQKTKDHC